MNIQISYNKENRKVYNWLLLGCALIGVMVIIGGITRLTQSGLSMVEWDPVMGAIPPLSDQEWSESFELYKQSPEFEHYNSHFTVEDYKTIFFWEYLHRLIGRIIGLVFLVPCIIFWWKGYFNSSMKRKVLIIFLWGGAQGVIGWLMVKSGLVDNPHVSHYRLALHLMTAIGLMMFIYWTALGVKNVAEVSKHRRFYRWNLILFVLLIIQVVYGAFVAGLKAGLMYNTFPKMGIYWFPDELVSIYNREGFHSLFDSGGLVQFQHRLLAILVSCLVLVLFFKSKKLSLSRSQRTAIHIFYGLILIQFILGILTLINTVPISLGVLHQFVAMMILLAGTSVLYVTHNKN